MERAEPGTSLRCDVVVVGGGPCGVVAALTLAEAGRSVILLEAGPPVDPARTDDTATTLARYFHDGGLRALRGPTPTPTLQARALGGGSVFNSAICMRPPAELPARWEAEHRVRVGDLDPYLRWIEALYEVRPTEAGAIGARSARFRQGCEALGWQVDALPRMVAGCTGSGRCLTGCRTGAKRSADRRGVPELLARGGRVYTHAEVERLIVRGGRVRGVEAMAIDPETRAARGSFRVSADAVVLAAGVMASPAILLRSGLDGPGIGERLQLHPSSFAMALYDEDVLPWVGATQGLHSTAHMERGIKLEDLWVPHGILAARLPQGAGFSRWLSRTRQMGSYATWVTTGSSFGRIRLLPGGVVDRSYEISPSDLARLQDGIVHLAELSFAGGAREFVHGVHGLGPIRPNEVDRLRELRLTPRDLDVASNHAFGTLAMGVATDDCGRVNGIDGVVVADTSLFPDSPAANPMLLGMALARRNALALVEDTCASV
ncbi:MAG: GMC family oxidoreductase [Pseudomonadota bacterium]|nr:GMC family oxidoreductase [Pseudomonadota bacterium]